jgi:hypothetical protein
MADQTPFELDAVEERLQQRSDEARTETFF